MLNLSGFTGTEQYHKLTAFGHFVCTDGVHYVAEQGRAYWLVDAIASYQHKLRGEEFQCWNLKVKGNTAVLTCDDGNDKELIRQEIEYTDFPQDIKMYLTNDVLMLTSEY